MMWVARRIVNFYSKINEIQNQFTNFCKKKTLRLVKSKAFDGWFSIEQDLDIVQRIISFEALHKDDINDLSLRGNGSRANCNHAGNCNRAATSFDKVCET